jgi:predicted HAD superfamily Cof-like phosphohydrolase
MTSLFKRTENWMNARTPNPTPSDFITQVGVLYEEMNELTTALATILGDSCDTHVLRAELHRVAEYLKDDNGERFKSIMNNRAQTNPDLIHEVTDAFVDVGFVALGAITRQGFNNEEIYQRVMESNESKFIDGKPVVLPNGKFGQGPNYRKFNIKDLIFVNTDN